MVYWVDDAPPPRDGPSQTDDSPSPTTSAPYAHHYSAHSFKGMHPFAYIAISVILFITTGVLIYVLYGCCASAKRSEERHQEEKRAMPPGSKTKVTRWRWAKMRATDDSHVRGSLYLAVRSLTLRIPRPPAWNDRIRPATPKSTCPHPQCPQNTTPRRLLPLSPRSSRVLSSLRACSTFTHPDAPAKPPRQPTALTSTHPSGITQSFRRSWLPRLCALSSPWTSWAPLLLPSLPSVQGRRTQKACALPGPKSSRCITISSLYHITTT